MQLLEALDCRLPSFLKSSLKISSFRAGHPKHSCSTCCVVWFTLAAFSALFSRHFTLTCRLGQGYTAHHGGPRAREQYHRFQESQHWIRVVRVVFSLGLANSMAVAATQGDSGLGRARLLFLSPGGGMVQTLGRQMLERTTLDLLKTKAGQFASASHKGSTEKSRLRKTKRGSEQSKDWQRCSAPWQADMLCLWKALLAIAVRSVRRLSLFRCNRLKLERASSRARVLEAWFWLHTTTPPTPIAVSRLHIRPGQDPHIFSDLVVQGMLLLLTDIGLLTSCQCACIFCARQVGCRGFALAKTAGPEPRPAIVRNFRAARQSQSGILRLAKVNDHDAWVQMDRIADGKSLSCQQDCSRLSGLQGFVLGAKEYFSCFFSVGGWCT